MQSMKDRFMSSLQGSQESVRIPTVQRADPLGMADINTPPTLNGNRSSQSPEKPPQQQPQQQAPTPQPQLEPEQQPAEEMSLDDQALMDAARNKDYDSLQRGIFSMIARYNNGNA